jgi:hypothetical protein
VMQSPLGEWIGFVTRICARPESLFDYALGHSSRL